MNLHLTKVQKKQNQFSNLKMQQNIISKEEKLEVLDQPKENKIPNAYQSIALSGIPRLLSLLDRNPYSKTYGSFSRNYWHYKTFTDFPSAPDQQGVLALACLYLTNISGNTLYQNKETLKLIEAGINYWTKIQLPDGSFCEWYPNEHSHVATAFTSYAISESLILLKGSISKNTFENAINHLEKSGQWLIKNIDAVVLNHTTGAVAALYNIYLLTNNDIFKEGAQKNLLVLEKLQNNEGWLPEYGGADPGYLGVSIDYLAKYWEKSKDSLAEKIITKALDFLIWFYQDNTGTTGGEYGSRNVKYILPHGLKLLSNNFPNAAWLENKLIDSLKEKKTISPETVDDRYFLFFHYPNYTLASIPTITQKKQENTRPKSFFKYFDSSGLVSIKRDDFHIILNLRKGGISSICTKDCIFNDSGYFAKVKGADIILTSQTSLEVTSLSKTTTLPTTFTIKTSFARLNNNETILKSLLIPFRIFNYIFGSSPFIMSIFNKVIKKKLVPQSKQSSLLRIERTITIEENKLTFDDIIKSENPETVLDKLSIEPSLSIMHVPSSKYFIPSDLQRDKNFNPDDLSKEFNKKGYLKIKRILNLHQSDTELIIST